MAAIVDRINKASDGTLEEIEESPIRLYSGTSSRPEPKDNTSELFGDNDGNQKDSVIEVQDESSGIVIPYEVCELRQLYISAEDFINGSRRSTVMEYIRTVVQTEAPISSNLLCKRILRACDISRMGTRVANYMDNLLRNMHLSRQRLSFRLLRTCLRRNIHRENNTYRTL